VGCKVSGNLSERVFLLVLDFTMAYILNYNRVTKQHSQILRVNMVVAKVVVKNNDKIKEFTQVFI
jgi:hypothetical protein